MFVINRKRIYFMCVCLMISIITFHMKSNIKTETRETVALPINEKTIIIDAGHGGEDGGASTDERCIRG